MAETEALKTNILMSIKPVYADMIFGGRKKYEFRKCRFTKPVDKVMIYSTKPLSKITGYFTFSEVLQGEPSEIWDLCSEFAGITKRDFFGYFRMKSIAYALKVKKVRKLKNPINPFDFINGFKAPRSFIYFNYEINERSSL